MKSIAHCICIVSLVLHASIGRSNPDSLALSITPETSYSNGVKALQLTQTYLNKKDFKTAFQQSENSIKIFEALNSDSGRGVAYSLQGDLYSEIADFEKGIKSYLKATDFFTSGNMDTDVNRTREKIGGIELRLGNYERALHFFQDALQYFQDHRLLDDCENVYYKMGILYGNRDKLDSSLIYFKKSMALQDSLDMDNSTKQAGLFNNMGAIYSKQNKYDYSLKSYQDAMDIFQANGNKTGIGVTFSNMGYLMQKQDRNNQALSYYDSSLFYLDNSKQNYWYLERLYNNLAQLHEDINNNEKALAYKKLYIATKDSLIGYETKDEIYRIQTKHELDQKNKELQYLENENDAKRRIQWLLILIVILIVVLAAVIIRLMFINLKNSKLKHEVLSQEKNKLTDQLKYKNKEVEDFALRIVEKNNFLEELGKEVSQIKADGQNNGDKIKKLTSNIRNNLYINKDRRDFESKLDQVHHAFVYRISEKIPNLTKSEKRLCSLLVMNLSTKDMSTILNISIQGVKTARHRLRKKLNLSQEEDLANFLNNL